MMKDVHNSLHHRHCMLVDAGQHLGSAPGACAQNADQHKRQPSQVCIAAVHQYQDLLHAGAVICNKLGH
jgi:hypothetical protein